MSLSWFDRFCWKLRNCDFFQVGISMEIYFQNLSTFLNVFYCDLL